MGITPAQRLAMEAVAAASVEAEALRQQEESLKKQTSVVKDEAWRKAQKKQRKKERRSAQ